MVFFTVFDRFPLTLLSEGGSMIPLRGALVETAGGKVHEVLPSGAQLAWGARVFIVSTSPAWLGGYPQRMASSPIQFGVTGQEAHRE
jgi:hypothetical protein